MTQLNQLFERLSSALKIQAQAAMRIGELKAQTLEAEDVLYSAQSAVRDAEHAIRLEAAQGCFGDLPVNKLEKSEKEVGGSDGLTVKVEMPEADDEEIQALVSGIVTAACDAIVKRLQLCAEDAVKPTGA
ncbi:hypothetical protein G7009_01585 [Pseudomonas capeferrum]|uniref:hypothetical protein n=1 Tax=Pseudomonas capeferrum TaxID=1495066 RepID=UPI0015E48DFB|nr:hypothetical protein [Pseudomonas capeferrum]MBA1200495.1 hypothetical protein [Pseudomonas capeferrum]